MNGIQIAQGPDQPTRRAKIVAGRMSESGEQSGYESGWRTGEQSNEENGTDKNHGHAARQRQPEPIVQRGEIVLLHDLDHASDRLAPVTLHVVRAEEGARPFAPRGSEEGQA